MGTPEKLASTQDDGDPLPLNLLLLITTMIHLARKAIPVARHLVDLVIHMHDNIHDILPESEDFVPWHEVAKVNDRGRRELCII